MESFACHRRPSHSQQYEIEIEQSPWMYNMTTESGLVTVKVEPVWGECGVSEAAAAEGLYPEHEVKDEVVIGPEVVQQQDVALSQQEEQKKKNREYKRAWRQCEKDLKKKVSEEEKEEEKRKRHCESQRAYYQRTKSLKKNDINVEELPQKKLDDLQIKIENSDSNEDQENVVQCRASQNVENVLEHNQFLAQQLRIYEESHECTTPGVILHRNTDIPGDGNCLFHSLICVLQLQMLTCDLRRQLRDSPYLNTCHNPQEAYNILSSDNEYGDLDCLYLFAKMYNQNICVHYHYYNVISKNEDTRFCHFKANDIHNWIHLDLREQHFTPYLSDDEKKKEDERKKKQRKKEYAKRYRDKKRLSNLQTGLSAGDVLDLQIKVENPDSNEDQENVVQCRASQNVENVLEHNQFLAQQLRIYEETHECTTPGVILHRNTDIPGDGNCLFHSLIRVLQLQMLTCDLRRQLRDSPYLNTCHNPQEAYNILSSDNEYGDLDCLYLFAKMYNQNICVHYHYFNVISKNEDTRFCHFKTNDTNNWIHLDLREQHFTPYLSDDEKKKEDERKHRQRNKEYAKRYRDKKRLSNLQAGLSARDALDLQMKRKKTKEEEMKQKQKSKEYSKRYRDKKRTLNLQTDPTTGGVPYVPPVKCGSQIADLSSRVPSSLSIHSKYNFVEDRARQRLPSQVADSSPPKPQIYSAFQQNSSAHRQFEKDFVENDFGHACDICDRLWFRNELKYLQNNDATPNIAFIRTLLSNSAVQKIKICTTCSTVILKRRVPPLSVYNGFKYPPIPDCLKDCPLDLVTERFIAARIPFVQIRRLRHCHGQYGIYGQVINVPIEASTMVTQLPRRVDDDHAITVHIKRKKINETSHVYGVVMKRKIKVWLRYLKDTPLYKSCGVSVDDGFLNDSSYDVDDVIVFDEDGDNDILEQMFAEECLMAQQQTLMWNEDMYLRIAPGEGNAPKSLLFDEHAEELSFPQIYLGQLREFRHPVTPFMMATSELRRSDRRGVTPQHLLYMAMNIMRIRVKDSNNIAFKHDVQGVAITKEQIQCDDYIHGCIETNLAFLRSIPNSAYYWAERKRDIFSMIRQYGKPTVFFTISANEMGWPKLLQLLYNLKNNAEITVEEAANLHFVEKSTLINEDAVTCAVYFNKLVQSLLKILQSKRHSPFRKYRVLHYFKRIEFQHGGCPRAHILAWLDNAPEDALNKDYNEAIDLIDFLTAVSAGEASGNIQLQTHEHTFNCYKGIASRQQKCRFHAPFMPVKNTMILTPMQDTENGFQQYKARYDAIQKNLEKYDYDGFQKFYDENGIDSDDEYVKIIRAGINRPRVFPKREPCEKWHNPFNPFVLNVVRSNTDFQFVTDEYSCAAYVVEYVNKTNRGVSNLQRQIIEIINEHPEFNLFDVSKNISVNILKHTEMTSQEAAWYLLREPISKSSTDIVYIPTILPVERHRIKKTMKEISELEDDSTDVWKENWFDKYEKRPEDLAAISLAQFVAKYYKNAKGDYVLREEPKVIRYRNYDMRTDYNEYRREMVTLHVPFRCEESEILAESRYLQLYEDNEALILDRRKEFESKFDIEKTLEICRELCREHVPDDGGERNDVTDPLFIKEENV